MKIIILGAAGMLGNRLACRIVERGRVAGRAIESLILADHVRPAWTGDDTSIRVESLTADITSAEAIARLAQLRPDVVFHLAAIVSSEAEADFEKGYAVNMEATRNLFESLRRLETCPRVVFASSLAAFGGDLPAVVPDNFYLTPQSSYGTQKAVGELLLADYTRCGFLHGVSFRLPTIVIRPGAPNRAASSFLSSILREPLIGMEAILPAPLNLSAWIASPRVAVDSLLHAAELPSGSLKHEPAITGRGISISVGEMLDALEKVAGSAARALVKYVPDPDIERIVGSWPRAFSAGRARELGFPVDADIHEIIRTHIIDELSGALLPTQQMGIQTKENEVE
jgi:D-erythronate 2-dehydrogenase